MDAQKVRVSGVFCIALSLVAITFELEAVVHVLKAILEKMK